MPTPPSSMRNKPYSTGSLPLRISDQDHDATLNNLNIYFTVRARKMFSAPGVDNNNNNKSSGRSRARNFQALSSLFANEESHSSSSVPSPPPTPPSFNLEGLSSDFTLPDPPSTTSPNSTLADLQFYTKSSSPPPSISSPPPRAHSPPPRVAKGHKSLFALFGNDSEETPAPHTPTPTPSSPSIVNPVSTASGHAELFLEYAAKADVNKVGLRRAKKVNLAAFSGKGKKSDPVMEDAHFCLTPFKTKTRALFGVFDGHAGRDAADEAVKIFPPEFNKQLEAYQDDVTEAYSQTFANVDVAMKDFEYLGTTATVVYLWQADGRKYLQAANVGDSTAFLCRAGVAEKLTVDHKPSLASERERMRQAGVEVVDTQTRINGLAVSRSLGNHFVKEQNIGMIAVPYVGDRIEIQPTDTYLIVASDGLWDVITAQHSFDIISGMDAPSAASLLLSTALQAPKCNDNVTIIVVRLN